MTEGIRKTFRHLLSHLIISLVAIILVSVTIKALSEWASDKVVMFVGDIHKLILAHESSSKVIATVLVILILETFNLLRRSVKRGAAAKSIGIFYCCNNSQMKARQQSDDFLLKNSLETREFWIQGATGYATFASTKAPLHQAFKQARSLKIILLSPDSHAISTRATNVNVLPSDYKEEIRKTLEFLKHLSTERPDMDIQIKMYQNYPFWKYIFLLDHYVWVQQYPDSDHVRNAPCYAFQLQQTKQCERYGVYLHMEAQFNKRWRSHRLGIYNLIDGKLSFYDKHGTLEASKQII